MEKKGKRAGTAAVLGICLFLAVCLLAGCQKETAAAREVRILEHKSRLDGWERQLPKEKPEEKLVRNSIRGVRVRVNKEERFAIAYEPNKEKGSHNSWNISVPYDSQAVVNTEKMYEWFENLSSLSLEPLNGISEQEAGLKNTDTSIYIAYDSSQGEGEIGAEEPDAAVLMKIGGKDSRGNYYVKFSEEGQIYTADARKIDAVLEVSPFDYILKVVSLVNVDTVSQVQAETPDFTCRMEQKDGVFQINGKETQEEDYHRLYGNLLSVFISRELPQEIERNQEEPAVTLTFYRNTEDASDVVIRYYPYGEEEMYAEVNGNAFFLVNREDVENIQKLIQKNGTAVKE